MNKFLVVVESPAKAKTIEKFLGKNYTVRASMGHLRDLPKSQFGVDIENDFAPKYINIRGKGDLIKGLKDAAKSADTIFLATDPDREGEAIAWHLSHIFQLSSSENCRIEFNEITKNAVQNAIKQSRNIDADKVDAQQARRILDRIVGYKLSPLLWRKVRKGLSAGRVQSVAVRLICDMEAEIDAFTAEEYWTVSARLKEKAAKETFDSELVLIDGQKATIGNEAEANSIKAEMSAEEYQVQVKEIKKKERRRNPLPPFITSTLQQDSARKLGFTSRKTMMLAQQLYEGLDVGSNGTVGLISYMRTDSTRISEAAQAEARDYINNRYGVNYLPAKSPVYIQKKAQDAHEAIRPTYIEFQPGALTQYLSKDQLKLYNLIWSRFIASQMIAAVYDTITVEIAAGRFTLQAAGSQVKFAGFMAVYTEGTDEKNEDKDVILPDLEVGQLLKLNKILPKQHFTQPPPRYTEASLIKMLEEKGIGRPSTYSPIIETILDRGYVIRSEKKFQPTDLGKIVTDLLKQYFPNIVNIEFTAALEKRLDDVAEGEIQRNDVLKEFFVPFMSTLEYADAEIGHVELPVKISDTPCEHCGKLMVIKQGRYGEFLACPGFPVCRNTKPILKNTGAKCPVCGGNIIERRTKRGRVFFGCKNYHECKFLTWDTPTQNNCAVCGAFLGRGSVKKGVTVLRCSNENCQSRAKSPAKPKAKTKPKTTRRKKIDSESNNSSS